MSEEGSKRVAIGLCSEFDRFPQADNDKGPGFHALSIGYHSDGWVVADGEMEYEIDWAFTTGDIVGCGIDWIDKVSYFTRNGIFIGECIRPGVSSLNI